MTKHIHDELKCNLTVDAVKLEITPVAPALLDNSLVIAAPGIVAKPKKVRMEKAKMTPKKSRLDKATSHLYDLEDSHGPEKSLNIDLGLYQMEDF
ncbi:MAG TPA: hypothetical protein VLH35_01885 [Candidatus Acidoferrales bacterium]|nr:hypothetical protein [Candidatus Acidoferrales bacterium]